MTDKQHVLLTALAAVPDPGGQSDVVASGRVAAPRLAGEVATIILDVGGLATHQQQELEARIRDTLTAVPGVSEVRVVMTADKVARSIVAVGSGKGGVGKSTIAANLAIALARIGKRVGLVDADIYGPSQPRIMGTTEKPAAAGKQLIPVETQGIRMLSIGQLVEGDSALAWRGPMASNALAQLIEGDWGDCELLIVDLPPGTGDVQLSLLQKWKPAGALIVSTPQDLALIDAARAIDLFNKLDVPILGLVENMSGYACPHCGEISDPFGSGGAEAAAAAKGLAFLGRIPLRMAIREASDAGTPPAAGESEEGMLFRQLAERLLDALNKVRS
jgi:ATP-binding protein involved in chromosome partitioning